MDLITLAAAKAYTDSQRLAHVETKLVPAIEPFIVPAGSSGYTEAIDTCIYSEHFIEGETYIMTVGGVQHKAVTRVNTGAFRGQDYGFYTADGYGLVYKNLDSHDGDRMFQIPASASPLTDDTTVTVELVKEAVHPIDPTFIPAMDSITLNGADGKQYRLTVDTSGALAVTEVE